jgi:hypothetical protein
MINPGAFTSPFSFYCWFNEARASPSFQAMTSFSILCTNSRNGGQHELLIDAATAAEAEQQVSVTRPHYIIKRTDAVEKKFVCIGRNRHGMYDELAYLTTSAEVARARCQELNPAFAIDRVEQR